jgi:hypothetical protein
MMKGKIDNNGWLRIERGGKEKLQECPYTQKTFQVNNLTMREPCGDWCPLFGEPMDNTMSWTTVDGHIGGHKTTELELCRKKLYFDEFTDGREDV